jgi:hypothetical protein
MNFAEAIELHKAIAAFLENIGARPRIGIYDIQSRDQGYILCVKETSTCNGFLRDFLKRTAQAHKLDLSTFKGYFILNSFAGISLSEN